MIEREGSAVHASKNVIKMITIVLLTLSFISLMFISASCKKELQQPAESTERQLNELGYSKAFDFELIDQMGKTHKLSDYRGKIVYLTFWATWCGPCKQELPDLESLYKDRGMNAGEVVVLGVVLPSKVKAAVESEEPQELTVDEIKAFLSENNVTFPVLMDESGKTFLDYAITGLPTTFLIDREGFFIGYIPASIERSLMDHFVDEALQAKRNDA